MNLWKQLAEKKKLFFVLAPMADVTDWAFRQIIVECGKPDVLYTEFVSVDGLCSDKGRPRLLPRLKFSENERPIVAQFFGNDPKDFYECAKLALELGFDGIDINMGCPDRKVLKQGSGASLILNPELASLIVKETKRGAGKIPVSIKTRIGYGTIDTEAWIGHLIEIEPAAILIHGRTAKEMSKVPAHWDEIGKAAKLCNAAGIPVIGNGDITSYVEAIEMAGRYRLDGIMIGRGIFSDPWIFQKDADPKSKGVGERVGLMRRHIKNFVELWGPEKHFDIIKRFIKIYINDFDGAKELRNELMTARNPEQIEAVLAAHGL